MNLVIENHYKLAIRDLRKLNNQGKLKLLEIGAGLQTLKKFLPENIQYDSLDSGQEFFKRRYTYNHDLNTGKMPIKNEIYDIVVCNEVLEHVFYPEKVIEEIDRISKKDAILFFSLPNEYNFVMRLYYLIGKKTKTEESFKVVEKGLHIHKPRVKDILGLFSKHFKIEKIEYIWQSRSSEKSFLARFIDKIINQMAQIWPSLFSRVVVIKARKRI